MSIFNEDLSTIKEKIEEMSDIFAQAKTKEDYYHAYISYRTLCDIYKELSEKEIYDLSGSMKLASYLITDIYRKEYIDEFYRQYYLNKDIAKEMFKEAIINGERKYDSYLINNPNKKIDKPKLTEMESLAIIYSFIENKFPEDLETFEEILKNGRIYYSPFDSKKKKENYYYYDIYNNEGNIYITKPLTSIESMVDFINQFGHIIDCKNLSNNSNTSLILPVSNTLRFDSKYISSYYKLEFLKYLINNNIYKEEGKIELLKMFKRGFKYIEDGYLVSLSDEKTFSLLKYGNISKNELIDKIKESKKEELFYTNKNEVRNYLIRLPKISSVSYGTCLSLLTNDKEAYINYLLNSNRNMSFKEKIKGSRMESKEIGKKMVKTLDLL